MTGVESVEGIDLRSLLDATGKSPFQLVTGDRTFAGEFADRLRAAEFYWPNHRLVVRQVRGARCLNKLLLLSEFSAALQFPEPATNWDAFEDWMTDLTWLNPGAGYVLLLDRAREVLSEEVDERPTLVEILSGAAVSHSKIAINGALAGRPPTPFHIVLIDSEAAPVLHAWPNANVTKMLPRGSRPA